MAVRSVGNRADNSPRFNQTVSSSGETGTSNLSPPFGYSESFNSKLRDKLLNVEIFDTMWEEEVLTKIWMQEYNTCCASVQLWFN